MGMKGPSNQHSAPIIYSHTGIRGIAAMYVVIFHIIASQNNYNFQHENAVARFFQCGGYAVDLFFILSGFILNWVYLSNSKSVRWLSFGRARAARILPLYFATTLLSISPIAIYSLIKHGTMYVGNKYPIELVLNGVLLSGIVSDPILTFNPPAWSICVEFFCYFAVFPLIILLSKVYTAPSYSLLASVIFAGIFINLDVLFYSMNPIPIGDWLWKCGGLAHGVFGFSTGFFLCSIHQNCKNMVQNTTVINLIILALMAVIFLVVFDILPRYLMLYAFALLIFFTAMDKGFVAGILKTRPFQWMGERSYSIYLWHWLCMLICVRILTGFSRPAYSLIIIALVLAVSELSYRYFECPLRDFIKKPVRTWKLKST